MGEGWLGVEERVVGCEVVGKKVKISKGGRNGYAQTPHRVARRNTKCPNRSLGNLIQIIAGQCIGTRY